MKNSHIRIESNLTKVILLYFKNPFIKNKFNIMIIEILLNDDIQLFFCSNDFKLSKGNNCNYVHY
jgi:hypothetical protein